MARIAGLGPESEALAKQALMILVCAREALRTEDLTYALSVEPDSEALDYDNIPDIEDVAGICAGLIVIDKESNIVKLVHKSAQEYFERNQSRWFPRANETMARLCIDYKSLTSLLPGFNKAIETTWPPFWRYADINWTYHYNRADNDDGDTQVLHGDINEDKRLPSLQSLSSMAISLLATDICGSLPSALLNACRDGRHALMELLITVNDYDLSQAIWNRSTESDAFGSNVSLSSEIDTCSETGTESDTDDHNTRQYLRWDYEFDDWEYEPLVKRAAKRDHYEFFQGVNALSRNRWRKRDSDLIDPSLFQSDLARSRRRWPDLLMEESLIREEWPLVIASANGDHAMVKILLKHGADPNVVGTLGQTALYIAARHGKHAVVSLLLDEPTIDPNWEYRGMARCNTRPFTRDMRKTQTVCWTPLLVAAYSGRKKCVRLLLDRAERNYRDGLGRNAACLAAEAGSVGVLAELFQWSDIELGEAGHSTGLSPLNLALLNRKEKAALALIPYSDINCQYSTGDWALNLAAKASSLKVIQKLLAQRDVRVNAKGFKGQTVLHNAAELGSEEMMALILAHPGVDINIRDDDGNSPLIRLSRSLGRRRADHSDTLVSMLSWPELNVNMQNLNGNTALLVAASFDCGVLHALLSHPSVDKEHRNNLGQTALSRAIMGGSKMVQTIVRETQLLHQFKEIDDEGETLLSLAAAACLSKSDWHFIVDLSPPEFMHRENRWGDTPEQIREKRLGHSCKRPSLPSSDDEPISDLGFAIEKYGDRIADNS